MNTVVGTLALLLMAVILGGIATIRAYKRKIKYDEQEARDKWLEALLNPSTSLETIMLALYTNCHYLFYWDENRYPLRGDENIRRTGLINLRAISHQFSECLMWKLVDVFVRNAKQHYQVLSAHSKIKDGDSLILHIKREVFELYNFKAVEKIKDSSLSEETKAILLR